MIDDVKSSLDGLLSDLSDVLTESDPGVYVPSEINDMDDLEALRSALGVPGVSSQEVTPEDDADGDLIADLLAQNNALLSALSVDLQSVDTSSYLFSPTSTQAQYFRGVMLAHPFWDYYAFQDSANSYTMYYAPQLEAGKRVHVIQIYRVGTNAYYNIRKEEVTYSSLSGDGMVISNLYDHCARFDGVDQVRNSAFITLGLCVALGFAVLSRIFFRR